MTLGFRSESQRRATAGFPSSRHLSDLGVEIARRRADRVVGGPLGASLGSVRDQAGGPLGQGCREHRRDREARLHAEHDGTDRARRVHHGPDVFHLRFQGQLLLALQDVVGQPRATPIQQDQSAEDVNRRGKFHA